MQTSFIFLAEGVEELEAISTIDILRRAGMDVKSVSIANSPQVMGAHGITISADLLFEDVDFTDCEWLILPGGMPGAKNLAKFNPLKAALVEHNNSHGRIAAICASPSVVLAPLGILDGKEAICYPGFEKDMNKSKKGFSPVVIDDNIITANGPVSAIQFALSIVSKTIGDEIAREIAEGLLLYEQHHEYYF